MEDDEDDLDNLEITEYLEQHNSEDGCVKYHDIYIRATMGKEKLFILLQPDKKSFTTKFQIYKENKMVFDKAKKYRLVDDKNELNKIKFYIYI
jgi:hypothetical protein